MKYAFRSEVRKNVGKNSSHRLREKGYVPAVIYGSNINTIPIELDHNEVQECIRNNNGGGLVTLNIDENDYTVFIKEIQKDPVTGNIIHLDFQQVDQNEKIHVLVPIILKGKSNIKRSGSILQQQLRDLEVECSANNIPKALEVDISHFKPGDTLKVGDVEFGEEISIVHDAESIIASVAFAQQNIESETEV
ncbi:50S ribosomal protein L25 [Alkaliphilus oremlandii]|uniref:Large ribosomal subunit protein bL25 n=1 Tax=Alkaliphilus oremlandii (strain OhILAs) TaxID=350688 RepID=A8MEE4_ALKOO|nr:50S ribosomal protein L25 [Alkaliphilus oremlandii]ABW17615.1 ribosomal 5S rRNA E-loop binding protein Ctc/L25/TL5 [Alkaliphilus oremlandii OhILAs]